MKNFLRIVELNKGSIGVALGFMLGCSVSKIVAEHEDKDVETELVVTTDDLRQLRDNNSVAVYESEWGPLYLTMDRDKARNI